MDDMKTRLISAAVKAKEYSYSPFSNFRVGAAVLAKSGNIYTGCNIENSSYGATICAERTAFFKAVSQGETEFVMIAIISDKDQICYPCGICRQVLYEFCPEISVLCCSANGGYEQYILNDLLPKGFKI